MREHGGVNGEGTGGQWFLAAACLGMSLVFYLIPTGLQHGIASGIRLTLLRPFVGIRSAVSAARVGGVEADYLRAQRDSLQAWITNNAYRLDENRRLRVLSGLAARVEGYYRAANVYRPDNPGSRSMLVLDIGLEDGVHAQSPILAPGGLAGRVMEAHASASIGMDWSHPDFRASAMTEDGEFYGIVRPELATFGDVERLVLTGIPYHASIGDGTSVVTSGRGGVFPRGVPIGRLGGVAEVDEGWHRSYWIYPSVHPGAVTHALVGISPAEGPEGELDLSHVFPLRGSPPPSATEEDATRPPPATDGVR